MPGPLYGTPWNMSSDHYHARCQKKEKCQGPGCKVYTGKTAAKRRRNGAYRKGRKRHDSS